MLSDLINLEWITVVLCVFLPLFLLLWYKGRSQVNFPDGPTGLPIVGAMPFLGRRPELTFMKWSKSYGNVFGLKMGRNLAVVLNDYTTIHQALARQGNHFSYRPRDMLFDKIGRRSGISMIDLTEDAKRQKNFLLNSLRKSGFARKTMESSIVDEAKFVICAIRECGGEYRKSTEAVMNAVANVICQLAFGRRFEYDDNEGFLHVARMLTRMNIDECLTIQVVMMLPFMRFYPPLARGIRRLETTYSEVYGFIGEFIEEHRKTIDYKVSRDFIDDYLTEIKKHEGEKCMFTERMLLGLVRDLFVAGTDTTFTTFKWLFLILSNRPKVQEKMYQEIIDVVGPDGRVTLAHKEKMPYTQAVIQEVLRYRPAVPLALPHTTSQNTTLFNRDIPKGTMVMPNLFAANHDPSRWENPDEFLPDRHLDENGAFANKQELLTFSIGPRACIGAQLAKMEIYLIATTILQMFKVVPAKGSSSADLEEPAQSGLILSPPECDLYSFQER